MIITATHINYYQVCKRKLWLFANQIQMEHTSDTVYDGKVIHETTYPQRADRYSEVNLQAAYGEIKLFGKIDFYDARHRVIQETKRSNKIEKAHEWQAKFYLWLLKLNGIEGCTSRLEYPLLRQTSEVGLTEQDIEAIRKMAEEITHLVKSEKCPPVINARICKSCSYYDFCYANET